MHLTVLSGYHFVHHLFDAAIAAIKYCNKSLDEKVHESNLRGSVVESRVSVLEQQFSSFRAQSDLDFAIQQELNDWNENQSAEHFFVISGLSAAPPKLTGGIVICLFLLSYFIRFLL